jgi:hypothetical protein
MLMDSVAEYEDHCHPVDCAAVPLFETWAGTAQAKWGEKVKLARK